MRFELIAVGPDLEQAVIRFHPRLTVIGGMDRPERAEFGELFIQAMTGQDGEVSATRCVDNQGLGLNGARSVAGWGWTDDQGRPCEGPMWTMAVDEPTLRRLMHLSADIASGVTRPPAPGEDPELTDARHTLASLEAELRDAIGLRARADDLRAQIAAIDEGLRTAEATDAQRRHTLLLAELERVRVEAATIQGGTVRAEADRRFIAVSSTVAELSRDWRQARHAVRVELHRFGARERLDARTLGEALTTPDRVPPELDALAALYEAAEAQRAMLSDRLTALTTGSVPQPSHPAVAQLARADQDTLWAACAEAAQAERRLEEQSMALGGLEAEGIAPAAASALEDAHEEVERAEREASRRRPLGFGGIALAVVILVVGLLWSPPILAVGAAVLVVAAGWGLVLPADQVRRRAEIESDALQQAGVHSYMTFQLRRLEVNIEPKVTEPLELAALEYRRALEGWRRLAAEIPLALGATLEGETRAYARALAGSRDAADEIAGVRAQLVSEAEPAVARARERLFAACAPFGIEDPQLAVELVRHQAQLSTHARLQAAVEAAEAEERQLRAALDAELASFGLGWRDGSAPGQPPTGQTDGPAEADELEQRLEAFDQARVAAEGRERARAAARPSEEVDADLARLEARVAEAEPLGRQTLDVTNHVTEDVDSLRLTRAQLVAEYGAAHRNLPDVERLTDRREALERRVAVLASRSGAPGPTDTTEIEDVLLARLAAARRVGPRSESMTVVLDDPFETIKGDRKVALLDTVERLSAAVQLVYLTDDVDVLVWARRRKPDGAISLLEPTADPSAAASAPAQVPAPEPAR